MARITVKLADGRIGTIDEREYNPQVMAMADQQQQAVQQPQPVADKSNFLKNLISDAGENLGGLLALPGALGQVLMNPGKAPEMGKNIVEGVAGEYGSLVSNPLGHAYEKPISTVLDVLPFLQAGKLAFAGKAGKTGQAAKAGQVMSQVKPTGAMKTATSMTQGLLTIPRKIAPKYKPAETVSEVLKHNPGAGSLDDLAAFSGQVTGESGAVSKLSRNVLSSIRDDVSLPGVINKVDNYISKQATLVGNKDEVIKQIYNFLPDKGTGKAKANAIFDSIQQLESQGHQLLNSSTDLSPNLHNTQLGNAYLNTAKELKKSLDTHIGDANILDSFKTPEVIGQLQQISPRLAQQFQDAKTWTDLRHIQSPFVKLQQMIDITQNSQNAPFNKLAGAATRGSNLGILNQIPGLNAIVGGVGQGIGENLSLKGSQAIANNSKVLDFLGGGISYPVKKAAQATKQPLTYDIGRTMPRQGAMESGAISGQPQAEQEAYQAGNEGQQDTNKIKAAQEFLAMKMIEDAASGGKNIAKLQSISAALEKLGGGATKKKTETQVAREETAMLVDDALSQLSNPNLATGPIAPQFEEAKAMFNMGDESTLSFNKTISALKAAIAKARAGTSFTPNEEKLLNQYAPTIGDSRQQLGIKLQVLKGIFAKNQNTEIIPNNIAPTQGEGAVSYYQ